MIAYIACDNKEIFHVARCMPFGGTSDQPCFLQGFGKLSLLGYNMCFHLIYGIKEKQEMTPISCFLFDIRGDMAYYF